MNSHMQVETFAKVNQRQFQMTDGSAEREAELLSIEVKYNSDDHNILPYTGHIPFTAQFQDHVSEHLFPFLALTGSRMQFRFWTDFTICGQGDCRLWRGAAKRLLWARSNFWSRHILTSQTPRTCRVSLDYILVMYISIVLLLLHDCYILCLSI